MIQGKSIILRAVVKEDLEKLRKLRNEHFADNVFRQYRPLTSKDQEGYWEKVINHENFVVFTICVPRVKERKGKIEVFSESGGHESYYELEEMIVVGEVRTGYINWRNRWAELGIFLGKDYMGFGFGREALYLMLDYAFNRLGLHAIRAETVTERVSDWFMEFGFEYIGATKGTTFKDGEWMPDHILEVYEDVWRERKDEIYDESVKGCIDEAPKIV